jgi:WD40 repeat protein
VLLVGTPGGATVALAPEPSPPRALAFSPDGALLAAVEEDGVVRLLDAHTGVHVAELLAPDGPKERLLVSDPTLSFSADGTRLVAVTDRARVWNVASRTHVCTVAADWVYDARLSTDGKRLVGSSRTGAFARFDGACVLRAEGSADTGGTFGASLSPDARFLASSEQGHGLKIHVLEPRGERDVQTPVTTCRHHVSPGFSDDGTKLIVLADWFRSYKTSGFSLLAAWTPPAEERESIQATLDDGLHVIEQDGAHAAIVDVRKPSARVPFDAAGATRFRGSPDSAFVLGIAENEARVWLTATGAFAAIVRRP